MIKPVKLTKKKVNYFVISLEKTSEDYIQNKEYHCNCEYYTPDGSLLALSVIDEEEFYQLVPEDLFKKVD